MLRFKFASLLILLLTALPLQAQEFRGGLHYDPLGAPLPVPADNSIEVIEFFWYSCPHCFDFDPILDEWVAKKPEDVKFVRIPAMFNANAQLQARLFYALELMGELDRLHKAVFETVNVARIRLDDEREIDQFAQKHGVDVERLHDTMNSFAVEGKLARASDLARRYGIRGVPTMVVNGQYRSGKGFRTQEEVLKLVDYLVAKVRAERARAQAGAQ